MCFLSFQESKFKETGVITPDEVCIDIDITFFLLIIAKKW